MGTERRSLIEEIVEEQKANESEGSLLIEEEESDEGLIGTINETQMQKQIIAVPQITPSNDNSPMVNSVSYSYAESIGLPEDEKKDEKKNKVKDKLRKQREDLKKKMEEEMELVRMGTMDASTPTDYV